MSEVSTRKLHKGSSNNGDPAVPTEAPEHPESTSSPRLKGKPQSRTAGTRPRFPTWKERQSLVWRKLHDLDDRLKNAEAALEEMKRPRIQE
jgi:hypothetical protein